MEFLPSSGVVVDVGEAVLADFAMERNTIAVLWPASRHSNPAVRAFLDHLREVAERLMLSASLPLR
ncbi:hypothetical protein [Azospirillum sp. BE72]|uniref:hypothetical protein n=1 Tax=Azospirillum sp. BE72 TaxID=2817776 RepID=UPI00285AF037|nr:hypothetical protein [Azospirillum sp. BE72]MDR6773537.1 DNA-binding transcriptional LysR family regulator [Azospirillum sp. BE72]